jgi:hypothetical protein
MRLLFGAWAEIALCSRRKEGLRKRRFLCHARFASENAQPMKVKGLVNISGRAVVLLGLMFSTGIETPSAAGTYLVNSVVTNFTIYLRRAWTNDSGRFFPSGSPMRLSDFSGSILFVEFFDPT